MSDTKPIKGKEEILETWISKISSYGIRDIEGDFEFYCDEVLEAMEEYKNQFIAEGEEQNAILFAQFCSNKNIYPNNYSYKLYKKND